MQAIRSSESTEGNAGEHSKDSRAASSRVRLLPIAASLLALAWLLLTPNAAFAQHGGGGGGHVGGGHASGGGHPSGGAAPASHPGGAAPVAHTPASPSNGGA